ncbi:MAG TPA: TlpA family protein disulfide reductase [Anaeromyxobacteraceae bacterium]|nr:TlpA family protein disulfide reductase [Anaeromyxobacteraceae bacterium]
MIRVELYARAGSAACDEARATLARLRQALPFDLAEVDVAADAALERELGDGVPRLVVDGRRLRPGAPEAEVRRAIERAVRSVEGSEAAERPALSPRAQRRLKVAVLALALLSVAAVLGRAAWQRLVEAPRLAELAFDITRIAPIPAPELGLELRDGRRLTLASLRGQVVFVNFWATWCPPCRDEMPSMLQLGQELSRRYPGRFTMVGVSVDEGWDPIAQFFGGGLPPVLTVALDRDQSVTQTWYCAARGGCPRDFKFPETYLVDRSGRLVAYVVGPRDWSDEAPRRFLERLLE